MEMGIPKMPMRAPSHKTQSQLLQRGLLPNELNDADALTGSSAAPKKLTARESVFVTVYLLFRGRWIQLRLVCQLSFRAEVPVEAFAVSRERHLAVPRVVLADPGQQKRQLFVLLSL